MERLVTQMQGKKVDYYKPSGDNFEALQNLGSEDNQDAEID